MKHLDLCSGIGGFALGFERAGMQTVAFVEIDRFCREVLKKNWPHIPVFSDIREFGREIFDATVDVVSAGFPCQPFSVAGRRRGKDDDRYLWPEMFRVVCEYHPAWVVLENVRGILSVENGMVFEGVCANLEGQDYEVQALVIPACAVNAPHRRDRVWIVAHRFSPSYAERLGREAWSGEGVQHEKRLTEGQNPRNAYPEGTAGPAPDSDDEGLQGHGEYGEYEGTPFAGQDTWEESWIEVATRFCRVDDGVSGRVDRHRKNRLKALGNAIVPQIAEAIGRAIMSVERWCNDESTYYIPIRHDERKII